MDAFLDKWHFLKSRKFWAAAAAFVAVLSACIQVEPFPWQEFIEKTVWIVLGYIGGTAFEDGMAKRDTGKTMVEAPAGTDVELTTTASETTPPQPFIDTTGLR